MTPEVRAAIVAVCKQMNKRLNGWDGRLIDQLQERGYTHREYTGNGGRIQLDIELTDLGRSAWEPRVTLNWSAHGSVSVEYAQSAMATFRMAISDAQIVEAIIAAVDAVKVKS